MKQYILVDIDGTMSIPLVKVLNALPEDMPRVVVTARWNRGPDPQSNLDSSFSKTWQELVDLGLDFDELYMRDPDRHDFGPKNFRSPGRFKAAVVKHLRDVADMTPFVAFDDDPNVSQYLKRINVPVVRVVP